MMPKMAIYPGSFNPVTNGHVDIIRRAADLFDEVIVALAESRRKNPLFSLEQRREMLELALTEFSNVSVKTLQGMTVEFAQQHQAQYIVRGLRTTNDFNYEYQLCGMNRSLDANIETVFLTTDQSHNFISSTIVREIINQQGDYGLFVPAAVKDYIEQLPRES